MHLIVFKSIKINKGIKMKTPEYFPCFASNSHQLFRRPLKTKNKANVRWNSIEGRLKCFIVLAIIPYEIIKKVGNLAGHTLEMLGQVIRKVSFNPTRYNCFELITFPFDVLASLPLILLRFAAHVICGIVGTIFHPAAVMKYSEFDRPPVMRYSKPPYI